MAKASVNTVKLTIVTPYKKFFEGDVSSVVINTIDGQMKYFTISEGYCEVSENMIKIVCNAAEYPEDLSPRRTCKSYTKAYEELKKAKQIEDRTARDVLVKEYEQAMARARARRHMLELYGSDHQKERIAILVKEYDWKDPF